METIYCDNCETIVFLDDSGYCRDCGKHADNMLPEQISVTNLIKPTVVHFKKHPYDIYIGRGSKWGNPFTHINDRKTKAEFIVESREEAISNYKEYVLSCPDLMASLPELNGKTLGCWCVNKPVTEIRDKKVCHGEVLMELVMQYCI